MCMSRKHKVCMYYALSGHCRLGVVTKASKKALFFTFVDYRSIMSLDSKQLIISRMGLIHCTLILVAQVPKPRDMAIFVLTTTTTMMTRLITLPLAHARGRAGGYFRAKRGPLLALTRPRSYGFIATFRVPSKISFLLATVNQAPSPVLRISNMVSYIHEEPWWYQLHSSTDHKIRDIKS